MTKVFNCPTCHDPLEWSSKNQYRPFCSEKCRLIDLGEWLSESYSLPEETQPHTD